MPPANKNSLPNSHAFSPAAGVRTGHSVADLKQSFLDNLFCGLGRVPMAATRNELAAGAIFDSERGSGLQTWRHNS